MSIREKADDYFGIVLPRIKILKFGYKTLEKKTFKLPHSIKVSPTHLTSTPETDTWFTDDDDHLYCITLIKNSNNFPIESSKEWLNENFCQFQKFCK